MPYGCLPLFANQGCVQQLLPPEWRYRYEALAEGEAYVDPAFDDSDWPLTPVPGQHTATAARSAVWYRVRFPRPTGSERWLLRIGGAFQATLVFLNGKHLGQHYGYFAPFAFDITDDLADENLLVICCETKVEPNLPAQKHTMGIFNDWDCRPYPNAGRGRLPEEYEEGLPLGLWAPVTLVGTGPVAILQSHYTTSLHGDGSAMVQLTARLVNLTDQPVSGELYLTLHAETNISGDPDAWGEALFALRPHDTSDVTLMLRLDRPRLWWPWTHGEPHLYVATTEVSTGSQVTRDVSRFGVRTVEYREEGESGLAWYVNGRPVFPKGTNYISTFRLDTCTYARLRNDVNLMRSANMDMVRVHAHVEPKAFYEACDELGVMVVADSVLNGCYGFGASPEDRIFQSWAARDQVEQTVNLLYNHASVVCWLIHNEPPWPDHMWWFGDPHKSRSCRELDMNCTVLARRLDPHRPVITASGQKDTHTYGGWYHATWLHYREVSPRFVTEYGAQALPNLDSPVWNHLAQAWPVDPMEPTWLVADYQPGEWAKYGVGAPSEFATLQEYVEASQRYQAWIARYGAERFRILKGRRCAGILHFMFVDGHPAITWAVVDFYRRTKLAYQALAEAYRPTHICLDPADPIGTDRMGRVLFPADAGPAFDIWLVNDDPKISGPAVVTWSLLGTDLAGQVSVEIPAFDAPALHVCEVRLEPTEPLPSGVTLCTELWQQGRLLDRNRLEAFASDAVQAGREQEQARSGPGGD